MRQTAAFSFIIELMIKFLAHLLSISFLLNFTWEISQMGFYSSIGMGSLADYNNFVKIHYGVSIKDALMVVVIYLFIGFLLRNWKWATSWNRGWVILWLALPLWQGIVEYYSVYFYNRWAYAESMPLIFGIGILPILQMLILPSIAILFSRHLLHNAEN
jgi:hypothetical protein